MKYTNDLAYCILCDFSLFFSFSLNKHVVELFLMMLLDLKLLHSLFTKLLKINTIREIVHDLSLVSIDAMLLRMV